MSQSTTTTQTEFVTEEFETTVTDETIEHLATTIEDAVRSLRTALESDDLIEELLRNRSRVLREADSVQRGDPEPLTQRILIEPVFDALDYPPFTDEGGDFSDQRGQQADYVAALDKYSTVNSPRLLIEAEPVNKRLDQSKHGLGQVKDWLEKDKFRANLGMATDGLQWIFIKYDRDTYTHDTIADVDLQPIILAAFENLVGPGEPISVWLDEELRSLLEEFIQVFEFENFLSIASDAPRVIKERKQAITDEFYDEYVQHVFGIVTGEEQRRARSLIGDGIVAPSEATGDEMRLFAVKLMNRLIFIKFLEDKELVTPGLLRSLQTAHKDGVHPESLYKTFLEPLFFSVLNERPSKRPERIRGIDLYENIPYLNGGLFRPLETDECRFNGRDFDVRDSILRSIIRLLEDYSFSADGGPTDLDPSILGNVFEKTINHLTSDTSDQKKELGAYYTPDEITRFCAEETVRPALRERFVNVLLEQWDLTEAVADYEDIYDLIDDVSQSAKVIESLLTEIEGFRVLDPACGSGHFLTSVQEEIVGIRKALYEGLAEDPDEWELHKQTVIENVYGVDIVEPAVEIAKLRLWLSIIAEVDPEEVSEYNEDELALPNVVFNVRQGNSLIGYTDLMELDGDDDQARLSAWGPDTVRQRYGNIIAKVAEHKRAETTEEAQRYLQEAEELLDEYRVDLDEKVLADFREAGIEDIDLKRVREFEPFHWVLEFASVYADGGFDVVVGNPPWDVLTVDRNHFFSRYDVRFRTRPPREKDEKHKELLQDPTIASEWEKYQRNMQIRSDYYNSSSQYELQKPTVGGQTVATETDLSLLFFERVTQLAKQRSYVAQIMPGNFFLGATAKDLRKYLIDETELRHFVQFENKGIFNNIDDRYHFAICTFKNSGSTEMVKGGFSKGNLSILSNLDQWSIDVPSKVLHNYSPESRTFPFFRSQELIDSLSKFADHPPIGERIPDTWFISLYMKELDRANDSDLLIENPEEGDYPIYEGKNMHQFSYDNMSKHDIKPVSLWGVKEEDPERSAKRRIRMKNFRSRDPDAGLKKAIYNKFNGSGSQRAFVNNLLEKHGRPKLSKDDVLLDCTKYRIAIRKITNSTNERTLIASVLPKDVVTVHSIATIRPHIVNPTEEDLSNYPMHSAYEQVFSEKELFVLLGLLNSIPIDYLMRTKIDTNIVQYKLEESQMPRLTAGDDWFEYISSRAARLNCYGEAFTEMRERLGGIDQATDSEERKRLQAEIDAAAFHAYGLNKEETQFVCDDFHRVQNPRFMTDDYFDLVLKKYDELADHQFDEEQEVEQ